jgi:hypothetical protein
VKGLVMQDCVTGCIAAGVTRLGYVALHARRCTPSHHGACAEGAGWQQLYGGGRVLTIDPRSKSWAGRCAAPASLRRAVGAAWLGLGVRRAEAVAGRGELRRWYV